MSFEAKYYDRCAMCPRRIEPGDTVRYNDDGDLAHVECDTDDAAVEAMSRTETVCADCFLIHAGECL